METYINNKLISKIVLYDEYDADFEYREGCSEKTTTFLGIPIIEQKAKHGVWIDKNNIMDVEYDTEYFTSGDVYRIDWKAKRIYVKPKVIIYTADRNEIIQYFDTIGEAREFLNDILAKNQDINIIIK